MQEIENLMTPIELAKRYMSSFFGEKPIEDMMLVLDSDLEFIGPLYKFNSSKEYINSLKESPPVDVAYELVQEYENECSCCLVYKFKKPNLETMMAQVFEVKGNKITKIRLIFDASDFLNK